MFGDQVFGDRVFEERVFADRVFVDRAEAADALADALGRRVPAGGEQDPDGPVILGLPRGGVPICTRVAQRLQRPWDVLIVRKIGAPDQPELAIGAVGEGGVEVWNDTTRSLYADVDVAPIAARERQRVADRVALLRNGRAMTDIRGREVVIVDDGLATGTTMAAAVAVAREHGARRVIVAVPVGSVQAVAWLQRLADDVVCLSTPRSFISVGQHYERFEQVSDAEVIALLRSD